MSATYYKEITVDDLMESLEWSERHAHLSDEERFAAMILEGIMTEAEVQEFRKEYHEGLARVAYQKSRWSSVAGKS